MSATFVLLAIVFVFVVLIGLVLFVQQAQKGCSSDKECLLRALREEQRTGCDELQTGLGRFSSQQTQRMEALTTGTEAC